jgi:hypothetical protein
MIIRSSPCTDFHLLGKDYGSWRRLLSLQRELGIECCWQRQRLGLGMNLIAKNLGTSGINLSGKPGVTWKDLGFPCFAFAISWFLLGFSTVTLERNWLRNFGVISWILIRAWNWFQRNLHGDCNLAACVCSWFGFSECSLELGILTFDLGDVGIEFGTGGLYSGVRCT